MATEGAEVVDWLEKQDLVEGPHRVPITLTHVQYTEGELEMQYSSFGDVPAHIQV